MSPEATDFLYPFIDGGDVDVDALLADLARSAAAKIGESLTLRDATFLAEDLSLRAAATAMAQRFVAGGRLFTFGNGGSATDAEALANLFSTPPDGVAVPARSLAADTAVVTALANDIGFDGVFARQLMAAGQAGDVAFGISTSGNSANLVRAFDEAAKRDILCVGFAGYTGGLMAQTVSLTHCIVVRSESTHRIQEVQTAMALRLWRLVQDDLKGDRPA